MVEVNRQSFDAVMVASSWGTMAESARSFGIAMAARCINAFADLIHNETAKFCEQQPPTTYSELSARTLQSMALTGKITSISHADSAAKQHPRVASVILSETAAFCDRVSLNDNVVLESMTLTQRISNICFSDRAG